eukprot:TRINITY_DN33322_c0_g1_i1.p1 TRINITY_DN33322_c0_g1~~TRINITY_DN33322_c0_g1_i1.p1  ORF type:complete len:208 (-),score=28.65 TRINITY_DN33322_c0_g1_i1:75-698(-)
MILWLCRSALCSLYGQDGTSGKSVAESAWPSPLPQDSTIRVKFEKSSSALMFSVNSSPFQHAVFDECIPTGVCYCPAVSIYDASKTVQVNQIDAPADRCPLEVLLAVASLGKKYLVESVLSMTTQACKVRLEEARASDSIEEFEQILSEAIAADMVAVRMASLNYAKDFSKLRTAHDAGQLKPEAAYELQAIWPSPCTRPFKGARLA